MSGDQQDDGLRLRIVGDGTPAGTRVETLDGVPLLGVVSVSLFVRAGEHLAEARVVIKGVGVDAIGSTKALRCVE